MGQAIASGTLQGGVAVVPPRDTALRWHLATAGLRVVVNPEADTGLASSLRVGLRELAVMAAPDRPRAALVVLADQPLLSGATISRLVGAWRRTGRSVRPRYASRPDEPGHPVLLDGALWALAENLIGDQGLGAALRARPDAVDLIDVPGANPDVDTRADLLALEDQTE